MENKIWTKEEIKSKLLSGDVIWIERSILAIFAKQTADEQSMEVTNRLNKVGFTGADAGILSSFAKWLNRSTNNHLTPKQMIIARKKMPKYSKQLAKIANKEI